MSATRSYAVKELYFTHQGEGAHTGRPAVFCRFEGCNLWSGHEKDRATAICDFCDTDFVGTDGPGGGVFAGADRLADAIRSCWDDGLKAPVPLGAAGVGAGPVPARNALRAGGDRPRPYVPQSSSFQIRRELSPSERGSEPPYVVFTGGEPALQLRPDLIEACHARAVEVAIETNGTLALPESIDWITVSPKAGAPLVQTRGHELKLIWPQQLDPADLESLDFRQFFLQPMDGPDYDTNLAATLSYCRAHPRWQLSIQTHKYLGMP